jgi:raffinose/stachyose/melibiose transport system substrate-binding protein
MKSRFRAGATVRSAAVIAVIGLATVGLTGCGSSTTNSGEGSTTSGTVNFWGESIDAGTMKGYVAQFNKVYPKIKVVYKVLPTLTYEAALRPALASSSGPDIFEIDPGARLDEFKSFAEDMTPVVKKALGSDWKSKLAPIDVGGLTSDGKLTSLSVGATYAGNLWINQPLFTKYNLTPPKTLDQWVSDCAVFKSHGVGCFVQGASAGGFDKDVLQSIADSIKPGLWTAVSKGQAKWTDPGIVKTLSIWKELFTKGVMQPGAIGYEQYPDANNDFLTGKYAMIAMGTWYMEYATTVGMTGAISAAGVAGAKPFPIVPIAFPDVAGTGSKGTLFGDADVGLAVNKKSKVEGAANTFATWLTTSKAGQQAVADALDDLPQLLGVTPSWDSIKMPDKSVQESAVKALGVEAGKATESRFRYLNSDVQDAIITAATSVGGGSATPAQAAATLQAAAVASGVKFNK